MESCPITNCGGTKLRKPSRKVKSRCLNHYHLASEFEQGKIDSESLFVISETLNEPNSGMPTSEEAQLDVLGSLLSQPQFDLHSPSRMISGVSADSLSSQEVNQVLQLAKKVSGSIE